MPLFFMGFLFSVPPAKAAILKNLKLLQYISRFSRETMAKLDIVFLNAVEFSHPQHLNNFCSRL